MQPSHPGSNGELTVPATGQRRAVGDASGVGGTPPASIVQVPCNEFLLLEQSRLGVEQHGKDGALSQVVLGHGVRA